MVHVLTADVWFGGKSSVEESLGKVGSILNVAHSIRRPYWEDLGRLDWGVWYFRLASPDREPLSDVYCESLMGLFNMVRCAGKLPLLCHCRAGGHRGPAAAMFAAWMFDGRRSVDYWIDEVRRLHPGFGAHLERRVYLCCLIDFCKRVEKNAGHF